MRMLVCFENFDSQAAFQLRLESTILSRLDALQLRTRYDLPASEQDCQTIEALFQHYFFRLEPLFPEQNGNHAWEPET